jgi:hypothetical protein
MDFLKNIHRVLGELDYRVTGLTAVNLYGYGISTNVFDIAVNSDDAVFDAVRLLNLPEADGHDPYVYYYDKGFYIRIQGDLMGEPFMHPSGIKLHSKDLLIGRLEVYSKIDSSVYKAMAFIALTADEEKTSKYQYYWNRL